MRGEAGDVVVHGAVDLVGVSFGDQGLDDLDHLWDVSRGPRVMVRRADVEERGVIHERLRVVSGDLFWRLAFEPRRYKHLVFAAVEGVIGEMPDVREVHHLLGLVYRRFEAPAK